MQRQLHQLHLALHLRVHRAPVVVLRSVLATRPKPF